MIQLQVFCFANFVYVSNASLEFSFYEFRWVIGNFNKFFIIKYIQIFFYILWAVHSHYSSSFILSDTAWKVSKYGVFSGSHFPAFGPTTGKYEPGKKSVFGHLSRGVSIRMCLLFARSLTIFQSRLFSLHVFFASFRK